MLEVRRPKIADLEGIFACLKAYNLHRLDADRCADPDLPADAIIQVRNAVNHINLYEKCWVAEGSEEVLGFCCWDWLDAAKSISKTVLISVASSARSLGIGTSLQRKRLDEMREQGAREVHTWSDDPNAIRWYQETFGYKVFGHEPLRHCLHRFHFDEKHPTWAIHRGLTDRDTLAHLRLVL